MKARGYSAAPALAAAQEINLGSGAGRGAGA